MAEGTRCLGFFDWGGWNDPKAPRAFLIPAELAGALLVLRPPVRYSKVGVRIWSTGSRDDRQQNGGNETFQAIHIFWGYGWNNVSFCGGGNMTAVQYQVLLIPLTTLTDNFLGQW